MDDARRAALSAELNTALEERAQLDVVVRYLRDRLGLAAEAPVEHGKVDGPTDPAPGSEPEAAVSPGEFFGMSGPAAARVLLERFGRSRPLKTEQIFQAITKGGVKIQSSQGVYRSLFRDPRFTRVSKSTWGLAEWYPDRARKRDPEATLAEGAEGVELLALPASSVSVEGTEDLSEGEG